jgi:hypothetical protein
MNRRFPIILMAVLAVSAASAADRPTPVPTQVQAARKALLKAREEASRAKEAWDKSKLEATLWDQRYKRAYSEWAKSRGGARPAALEKRLRAEEDLKLALEVRRVNWYRSELASMRARAAEESLRILEMEAELSRVEERLKGMREARRATPAPSPSADAAGTR